MSRVYIQLVVCNGAHFIRESLDSLRQQTNRDFSMVVLDNASTDATPNIIRDEYPEVVVHRLPENIGFWAATEWGINQLPRDTEYVLMMTDVTLDPAFIAHAIATMDRDPRIGALQPKILQKQNKDLIDTTGFEISRSRRVTNKGQGSRDDDRWNRPGEIFAVEGALPFVRVSAWRTCAIEGHVIDPDFRVGPLGYGDDLDWAWRMRVLGWKQHYEPAAIAWHDRSTTTSLARGYLDIVRRVKMRQQIPVLKRRLDWSNVRLSVLKNDRILNILRDLPWIIAREIGVFVYSLIWEPVVLLEWGRFLRLLPRTLHKRRLIMARAMSLNSTLC